MNRRRFLGSCIALAAVAALSEPAAAVTFAPQRMSVRVVGKGPDVVLVHGLAAGRGVWNGTVAALPGYRYHLVQIGGFAGAPVGANDRGRVASGVADEIARYIHATGLRKPAVIGHSMGGIIALMLASRYPDLPGRVMVVDMVPAPARVVGLSQWAARPIARFLGHEILGADRLRQQMKSIVGRFGSSNWLGSNSNGSVVGRSIEELMAVDLTADLPRIHAPLTVAYACPEPLKLSRPRIDRFYAQAYSRRLGTRLVPIARSGHMIMFDQPALFRAEVKRFLG
ncbi:alpha/beta fold hydrolase [Sphingosinicella sp. BN140058]|uniref:alpha/beta fold hydrolase n=1 Tax=Sphingosinicella sp. BN140058 TaxID=1892855 RepID=UPI0010109F4B|nr:alpha/beta hydrolase [Sphingosinicella sp. BN140058]QAY76925.1 alpha/beta hydrolase [Sphingosinicella sp. BN140058]